jgi:hypothetical protein
MQCQWKISAKLPLEMALYVSNETPAGKNNWISTLGSQWCTSNNLKKTKLFVFLNIYLHYPDLNSIYYSKIGVYLKKKRLSNNEANYITLLYLFLIHLKTQLLSSFNSNFKVFINKTNTLLSENPLIIDVRTSKTDFVKYSFKCL